jgi:hypothetical protein
MRKSMYSADIVSLSTRALAMRGSLSPDFRTARREGEMGYYRLYMMTGSGGHIQAFHEIEAPDDAEAVRVASTHCGPQPLELWCRNRKVRSFAAETASAAG